MSARKIPEITVLNSMLGLDLRESLDRHQKLGLRLLDLKDAIFGKSFATLTADEALSARDLIARRNLEVYSLSSSLCHRDIEEGEAPFRHAVEAELKQVLAAAKVLQPKSVRLLSAWSSRRMEIGDSIAHLDRHHPWIYEVYRGCVNRLIESGYKVFIENEADKNILSTPKEIRGLFEHLALGERVSFTWDIQNLWQMGTFPSTVIFQDLRNLIGYLHFKGGQAGENGELAWASALEDASWPVAEIARLAVQDGTIPVFCLNPSHGRRKPGYDYQSITERDIRFLRQVIAGARP